MFSNLSEGSMQLERGFAGTRKHSERQGTDKRASSTAVVYYWLISLEHQTNFLSWDRGKEKGKGKLKEKQKVLTSLQLGSAGQWDLY